MPAGYCCFVQKKSKKDAGFSLFINHERLILNLLMKYSILIFACMLMVMNLFFEVQAQESPMQKLFGKWESHTNPGTTNNFNVVLNFRTDSLLVISVNDEDFLRMRFSISKDSKQLFMASEKNTDSVKPGAAHEIQINGDTLTLKQLYLPYKEEYNIDPKSQLYFIRKK
jgi:hypothetical protein